MPQTPSIANLEQLRHDALTARAQIDELGQRASTLSAEDAPAIIREANNILNLAHRTAGAFISTAPIPPGGEIPVFAREEFEVFKLAATAEIAAMHLLDHCHSVLGWKPAVGA